MVNIFLTSILIILFFFLGHVTQALKKAFSLITSTLLKILSFFGIKIVKKEKTLKMSDDFKRAYKDIKVMKVSKKNLKNISSINWPWFATLLVTLCLVMLNMKFIVGSNLISDWIYNLIKDFGFIKSAVDMNTMYTATLFSVLSFAANKCLSRWKATKQQRIENKQIKLKKAALNLMDSKELLNEAKKKDLENYKRLK